MKSTKLSWSTQQLCECALFAAFLAVTSQIQIALPLVPINLALFTVHLCAVLLARKQALFTILTYLLLGLIGLPVFSGFSGGMGVLFGPTGGYLIGYLASAWVTSVLVEKMKANQINLFVAMACGTLACYGLGTVWFMVLTNMSLWVTLGYCVFPFLIGDVIKITCAMLLAKRLQSYTQHVKLKNQD